MKYEVEPPWIKYPGYPPGDPFWRQTGENWFLLFWEPFWKSLTIGEQEEYLAKWAVPKEWELYYFDSSFREWLESIDE